MAKLDKGITRSWIPVIAGTAIVLLIGGGILVAQYKLKPTESLPESQKKVQSGLFLAIHKDKSIKVILYDLKEKKNVLTRDIVLDYPLFPFSQTSAWGSNNTVQYLEKTKEIFYLTDATDYYGSSCTVEPVITSKGDTICGEYLYKVNLLTGTSTILTELHPSATWILNKHDGFIYVSRRNINQKGDQIIQKINTTNGSISTLATYQRGENVNLGRLMISQDGKYIYQAGIEDLKGWEDQVLTVSKIDTQDGELEVIEIYRGSSVEGDTNLSSDGRRIAFYAEPERKLFVFDMLEKKLIPVLYEERIKNLNLFWSEDYSKILYIPEGEKYAYYNLENAISYPAGNGYPLLWAPSQNYIVSFYNKGIEIFDVATQQIITLSPALLGEIEHTSSIVGFEWF